MYETIKSAITGDFYTENDPTSVEKAFDTLQRWVSHLQDMDDFSDEQLNQVYSLINKGSNIQNAFKSMIDNNYEFADYNYFEEVINKYKDDLFIELERAIKSNKPSESWRASIDWLADHATVTLDSNQYTLNELQRKLK